MLLPQSVRLPRRRLPGEEDPQGYTPDSPVAGAGAGLPALPVRIADASEPHGGDTPQTTTPQATNPLAPVSQAPGTTQAAAPAAKPSDATPQKPTTPPVLAPPPPGAGGSAGAGAAGSQPYAPGSAAAWQRAAYELPPPPPAPTIGALPASVNLTNLGDIARGLGPAAMGTQYQTASGAWQGEGLSSALEAFARQWLGNPNPYGGDTMQAQLAAFDSRRAADTRRGVGAIEELAASRGLTGSSLELNDLTDLEGQQQAAADAYYAELAEQMAGAELLGRQSAGTFGLNVGAFQRQLGQDRLEEGRYTHEADRTRERDYEADRQARTGFELQAGAGDNSAALQKYGMESDNVFRQHGAELANAQYTDGANLSRAQLQLSGQELDLRAHQVQQDYAMRGQELSATQAARIAQEQYQREQLALNQREQTYSEWYRQQQLLLGAGSLFGQ